MNTLLRECGVKYRTARIAIVSSLGQECDKRTMTSTAPLARAPGVAPRPCNTMLITTHTL